MSCRYTILMGYVLIIFVFITCSRDNTTEPKPGIATFYPATATNGEPVKITGSNFNHVTSVLFGGVLADSFRVKSDSVLFAIVGAGNSGNVSVTNTGGTAEASGFTYYVPQRFSLLGSARWSVGGYNSNDTSAVLFTSGLDSGSLQMRFINRYDTPHISTLYPYQAITQYVDSPGYVLLSGLVDETKSIPNGSSGVDAYRFSAYAVKKYNLFAKITDTLIYIPYQVPRADLEFWGSGRLKAGKLTINYTSNYRSITKHAILTSK